MNICSVFLCLSMAAVEMEGETAAGDEVSVFLHPACESALYIHIYYFCFLSLHLSTTLFPHVSGIQSFILQLHAIHRKGRPSHAITEAPSLFILKGSARPHRGRHLPRPRLYLPTSRRSRSPALANKPLIFRSPLGTFCHYVPSARSHN